MPTLTWQHAGYILAFAGAFGMLFADPLARLDARLPWLGLIADERLSRRMVDLSSASCVILGLLFVLAARGR